MFRNAVITQKFPFKSLTAAVTLTASESGKTFGLATAGGFTVTLPPVAEGLYYKFIATVAPTTAYVISTPTADNDKIIGHVLSSSGGAEDTETTAGGDVVNFVANTAVIGDILELFSDGVYWYASARCAAAGGMTITG